MKMIIKYSLVLSVIFSNIVVLAQNPVIKFAADPSIHQFDGTYYIYPSHDREGDTWYNMEDWHAYSSKDLLRWKDEGIILKGSDITWAKAANRCWAPDANYVDGKYYFYFPVANEIGVAVSDSPAGPFKDAKGSKIADGIDPSCFIDDDGQAYLTWSTITKPWTCYIAKLKPNMIDFDGEPIEITGLDHFREGPWIHKKDGVYYLSYNSGGNAPLNCRISYAMSTAKSPMENTYVFKGVVIHSQEDIQATAHHSILKTDSGWVIAYHKRGPSRFERHTCLDYLEYNDDGTIKQVIPTWEGLRK